MTDFLKPNSPGICALVDSHYKELERVAVGSSWYGSERGIQFRRAIGPFFVHTSLDAQLSESDIMDNQETSLGTLTVELETKDLAKLFEVFAYIVKKSLKDKPIVFVIDKVFAEARLRHELELQENLPFPYDRLEHVALAGDLQKVRYALVSTQLRFNHLYTGGIIDDASPHIKPKRPKSIFPPYIFGYSIKGTRVGIFDEAEMIDRAISLAIEGNITT